MVNWGIDGIGVCTWLSVPLMGMEGMEALVGGGKLMGRDMDCETTPMSRNDNVVWVKMG